MKFSDGDSVNFAAFSDLDLVASDLDARHQLLTQATRQQGNKAATQLQHPSRKSLKTYFDFNRHLFHSNTTIWIHSTLRRAVSLAVRLLAIHLIPFVHAQSTNSSRLRCHLHLQIRLPDCPFKEKAAWRTENDRLHKMILHRQPRDRL
jgi:hypothetical protein